MLSISFADVLLSSDYHTKGLVTSNDDDKVLTSREDLVKSVKS